MNNLMQLANTTELLQYFTGSTDTTQTTRKYAASNIGVGLAVGDTIYLSGCSNAASNGAKTIESIASDNSYITVEETIGANETGVTLVLNQEFNSPWYDCQEFSRLVGMISCSGAAILIVEYSGDKGTTTGYVSPSSSGQAITGGTPLGFSYEVIAKWARFRLRTNAADQTSMDAYFYGRKVS